jgi:catechol 2,3-dioxygenase-like lactoylglutathione lyase family enzyme
MGLSDCEVGVVLASADMKAAREFYEGKLGLTPAEEPSDEDGVPIHYECGKGTGINVYESPDHAGKSTATLAGWVVDDVEAMVDELTSKGVTFEQYDQEQLKTNDKGIIENEGFKVAFFRDPDGNTHALNGS